MKMKILASLILAVALTMTAALACGSEPAAPVDHNAPSATPRFGIETDGVFIPLSTPCPTPDAHAYSSERIDEPCPTLTPEPAPTRRQPVIVPVPMPGGRGIMPLVF